MTNNKEAEEKGKKKQKGKEGDPEIAEQGITPPPKPPPQPEPDGD